MFGHDTVMALRGAAALINTMPAAADPSQEPTEGLPNLPALHAYLEAWAWSGTWPSTQEELNGVRGVRGRIRNWWVADETSVVADINALFLTSRATPRVVRHGDYGWHVHALSDTAPWHDRLAVEAAVAVVDLLRAGDLGRLKVCRASACERVLVDESRNRSRYFCGTPCADRTHAAAYRARGGPGNAP